MDTAPGYVNVLQCIVETINGVCMTKKELQIAPQNHTSSHMSDVSHNIFSLLFPCVHAAGRSVSELLGVLPVAQVRAAFVITEANMHIEYCFSCNQRKLFAMYYFPIFCVVCIHIHL